MADWIARANIEHFKKLLETETDSERRRVIESELADEELKLAALLKQQQGENCEISHACWTGRPGKKVVMADG